MAWYHVLHGGLAKGRTGPASWPPSAVLPSTDGILMGMHVLPCFKTSTCLADKVGSDRRLVLCLACRRSGTALNRQVVFPAYWQSAGGLDEGRSRCPHSRHSRSLTGTYHHVLTTWRGYQISKFQSRLDLVKRRGLLILILDILTGIDGVVEEGLAWQVWDPPRAPFMYRQPRIQVTTVVGQHYFVRVRG